MRSRRSFSVSELQNKDLQRCGALIEEWGVRHDLHVRMRELSSKFEGVEAVDVGTLPRRVRRENPDITSPLTKKRARQILSHITFPQVSRTRTARAEATSLVRETRAKVGDLNQR